MTTRPFVPIEASERSRKGLKANLADCRRIREVWLVRKAVNDNRDAGYSAALASQCTSELRAIAEEEAALAIDLLKRMKQAMEAFIELNPAFRGGTIGAPNSAARWKQELQIKREDDALALIVEYDALTTGG